jgi:hypothetical protein
MFVSWSVGIVGSEGRATLGERQGRKEDEGSYFAQNFARHHQLAVYQFKRSTAGILIVG